MPVCVVLGVRVSIGIHVRISIGISVGISVGVSVDISVGVGLLGADKEYPDSGKTAVDDIRLEKEWKRYRIRLRKLDLSSIKTGFVVTIRAQRVSSSIYLDEVRFIRK